MKYRIFGNLGWQISEIGFGAWAIGGDMWGPQNDKESIYALHKAIDLGVNFIDTAQGYGSGHSEEIIGKVLKERKEELIVATKVPPVPGTQWPPPEDQDVNKSFPPKRIIEECEKSLKRIQRDYIDIYQFHTWATAFNIRNEWYEAMLNLKEQGKIRATGVSVPDNTPDDVIGALALGKVDSVQVIYNIFEQYPEWNLFPAAERLGTGIIVRVPFDESALTGNLNPTTTYHREAVRNHYCSGNNLKAVIKKVGQIEQFKNNRHPDMPLAEYALRFCLSNRAVGTVIPGIRNIDQAEFNTSVSDGSPLPQDELTELRQFYWKKDFWNEEVEI